MRRYGIVRGASINNDIHEQAKALRREMTPAEIILWSALRKDRLAGYHFRRQQVIESFIVDFYCHRAGLIVEVDGSIHQQKVASDTERDAILTAGRFRILRIQNEEIYDNLPGVLALILQTCRETEAEMKQREKDV